VGGDAEGSPAWWTTAKILLCLSLGIGVLVVAAAYKTRCKVLKKGKLPKPTTLLQISMLLAGQPLRCQFMENLNCVVVVVAVVMAVNENYNKNKNKRLKVL
jgi:hypothetical protein